MAVIAGLILAGKSMDPRQFFDGATNREVYLNFRRASVTTLLPMTPSGNCYAATVDFLFRD